MSRFKMKVYWFFFIIWNKNSAAELNPEQIKSLNLNNRADVSTTGKAKTGGSGKILDETGSCETLLYTAVSSSLFHIKQILNYKHFNQTSPTKKCQICQIRVFIFSISFTVHNRVVFIRWNIQSLIGWLL